MSRTLSRKTLALTLGASFAILLTGCGGSGSIDPAIPPGNTIQSTLVHEFASTSTWFLGPPSGPNSANVLTADSSGNISLYTNSGTLVHAVGSIPSGEVLLDADSKSVVTKEGTTGKLYRIRSDYSLSLVFTAPDARLAGHGADGKYMLYTGDDTFAFDVVSGNLASVSGLAPFTPIAMDGSMYAAQGSSSFQVGNAFTALPRTVQATSGRVLGGSVAVSDQGAIAFTESETSGTKHVTHVAIDGTTRTDLMLPTIPNGSTLSVVTCSPNDAAAVVRLSSSQKDEFYICAPSTLYRVILPKSDKVLTIRFDLSSGYGYVVYMNGVTQTFALDLGV